MNTRGDKGFRAQLTDGWKWSADSLSLAFHLNPRARWHDGKPVAVRDVRFTFALNKNPELGGAFISELTALTKSCLITTEKVRIIRYGEGD